ncbi:MAG TPA: glucosyl transferase [Ignavibacteriales bacterium]|nr:glucosyl transferase [Ignavibacteriales bacterium]
MHKLKIFLIITLLVFIQVSCNTTDPKVEPELLLKLEDVSCTEAWLQLSTNNIQLPATINLLKNNSVAQTLNLSTTDSLLYIDSLLPNQNYSFQVSSILHQVSSNELAATTLDTTSHNFTWQTFEFGIQTNVSRLFDVAIINENNIWAVGEIYMNDSLGNPDPTRYNAIRWNGTNWTVIRIPYNYQGADFYNPIQSVFAFGLNDIWFCGNGIIHWDGNNFNPMPIPTNVWGPYQMNKIWGNSSNNLYIVGNAGNIARYNGSNWTKIESGTSLFLIDIAVNSSNQLFTCGINMSTIDGIIVKTENGTNFSTFVESDNIPPAQLFKPKLYGTISSVCFDRSNILYAAGNLVYQYKLGRWDYLRSLPENYIGGNPGTFYRGYVYKIRATASNDIWIAGDRNTLRHFNGSTWQQIGLPYDPQIDLVWRGMENENNTTVIVGSHNSNAIIMMIKK